MALDAGYGHAAAPPEGGYGVASDAPDSLPEAPRRCSNCNKVMEKQLKCGRCQGVTYCSALCQKDDWPYHKQTCKKKEDIVETSSKLKNPEEDLEEAYLRPEVKQLIHRLSSGDPSLTSLDLRTAEIGDPEAKELGEALVGAEHVDSILLEENDIGPLGMTFLARHVHCLKSLSVLNLDNNRLELGGITTLAESLGPVKTLRELSVGNNLLGPRSGTVLAELIVALPCLDIVSLRENFLSADGAELFVKGLLRLTSEPRLRIDFSSNDLRVAGAKALAPLLRNSTALLSLELADNKVHDFGVRSLAEALGHSTSLKHLGLSDNQIGDDGASDLSRALLQNGVLESLDLSSQTASQGKCISDEGAGRLAEALRENAALQTLDLSGNNIASTGGDALAAAMQSNTTLTSLSLQGNNVDPSAVSSVTRALSQNMQASG